MNAVTTPMAQPGRGHDGAGGQAAGTKLPRRPGSGGQEPVGRTRRPAGRVWGTMMPTNPIRPLTATAAAVARVRRPPPPAAPGPPSLTPRLDASSSPTASTSMSRSWSRMARVLSSAYGAIRAHLAPAGGGEAAQDPAVDLPQRLRLPLLDVGLDGGEEGGHGDPGEDRGRRAATTPATAPAKAATGSRSTGHAEVSGPWAMARVAPSPAPAAAPSRYGSARGCGTPLVGGAGQGQHGPDEPAQDHPGQAQLPQDGHLRGRQARGGVDQRAAGRPARPGRRRGRAGPGRPGRQGRAGQDGAGGQQRAGPQPGRPGPGATGRSPGPALGDDEPPPPRPRPWRRSPSGSRPPGAPSGRPRRRPARPRRRS